MRGYPPKEPTITASIQNTLSSTYHRHIVAAPPTSTPTTSLLDLLLYLFPWIEVTTWQERAAWGGLYYNGRPATPAQPVTYPCKVEYYEPKYRIADGPSMFPQWCTSWIIFEDEDFIAVDKPVGLPTQPGKEQHHYNLRQMIDKHIGGHAHIPTRLDMATSGVVVGSKSAKTHKALQLAFSEREVTKVYRCTVSPCTVSPCTVSPCTVSPCTVATCSSADAPLWHAISCIGAIGPHPDHPVLRQVTSGGLTARTEFRVVRQHPPTNSVELEALPFTGRTHQIRVHLADMGLPIVGDKFYGGRNAPRLHLHCYQLSLPHPAHKTPITVTSRYEWPWL